MLNYTSRAFLPSAVVTSLPRAMLATAASALVNFIINSNLKIYYKKQKSQGKYTLEKNSCSYYTHTAKGNNLLPFLNLFEIIFYNY